MSDDFASASDLQNTQWEVQDLYQWKNEVENRIFDLQSKVQQLENDRDTLELKVAHLENQERVHGSRIDDHRISLDQLRRHCRL